MTAHAAPAHAAPARAAAWTRSGSGRLLVVVADQAVNSVTNVVVVLVVAAAVPLREFGLFAAVTVAVQLGQAVTAAGVGDRLLQAAPVQRAARHAAGARLLDLATVAGVLVAVAGWAVFGPNPWSVALALMPALARVDYWRVWAVSTGRVTSALVVDLALGAGQVVGVVVWWRAGTPGGTAGAMAVWAGAAVVVVLAVAAVTHRDRSGERASLADAVSVRYGLEIAVVNGSGQIAQLVATAQLGLAFSGTLRAAQVPFGIVVVLVVAARAVLIPAMRDADEARARRLAWIAALAAIAASVAFTVVTLVVTAVAPLRFLVGGVDLQVAFVVVLGCGYAAIGGGMVQTYYLRARHRDREVSAGRAVMLVTLALGTAVAVFTRSSWVFLAALALAWLASSVAMALVRPAVPTSR